MLGKILLPVRTRNALKKSSSHPSVSYQEALQIGFLFRYVDDERFESILEYTRKFERDNKGVSMLVFNPKKEITSRFNFPVYTKENISFWGKLTSEEIDIFLAKDFDFLINLDLEPHDFVDNILARSKAKCKIGHYSGRNEAFCQMMLRIDPPDDFEQFLDQVYYYIKNLRANA